MKLHQFLLSVIASVFLLSAAAFAADKVNINKATHDELVMLKGIGSVTAGAIIQYREDHGSFSSVEDLAHVKGIGMKKIEQLADELTVSDLNQ